MALLDSGNRVKPMKKVRDVLKPSEPTGGHRYRRLAYMAIQFAVLLAFWFVLSGHYQVKYIVMGALSAGLVTFLTNDLLYVQVHRSQKEDASARFALLCLWHWLAYVPWLLFSIIKANIQVAYLISHPRLPIEPALLQFQTHLRKSIAQVTLANSITLTPGTVTVDLQEGKYLVHALAPQAAQSLLEGRVQNKVGVIFAEKEEQPPTVLWAHSIEEIK